MQKEKSDDGGRVCREEMMAEKRRDDKRKENQRKNSGGDLYNRWTRQGNDFRQCFHVVKRRNSRVSLLWQVGP